LRCRWKGGTGRRRKTVASGPGRPAPPAQQHRGEKQKNNKEKKARTRFTLPRAPFKCRIKTESQTPRSSAPASSIKPGKKEKKKEHAEMKTWQDELHSSSIYRKKGKKGLKKNSGCTTCRHLRARWAIRGEGKKRKEDSRS